MKIRVYYEDTDLGGVVYHSKYLNFCERARSELFFEKDKTPMYEGYHFVVKSLEANFFAPAQLGDELEVLTELEERKSVSIRLKQKIFKEGKKIFELSILLVCLKGSRPAKIPNYFLEVFAQNP